jgi:glycosyltransferase involved in cell wall biosynthesis
MKHTVDAIVPCFNEEKRIGGVLDVLSTSSYINKIIVIDDGSSDKSAQKAASYPKTIVIKLSKNRGKGKAVKIGLAEVEKELVFLCDSDIKGLKDNHIGELIKEYKNNPGGLVIGIRKKHKNKLIYWVRRNMVPLLDGERIVAAKDLGKVVRSQNASGYGLEAWMNYYFRKNKKKTSIIPLAGVYNPHMIVKREKAIKYIALEYFTCMQTYSKIYKDELKRYSNRLQYKI